MILSVNSVRASQIALKFFEQYNSDVAIKKTTLQGDTWIVNVSIGLITKKHRQVKIDAITGKILEYS